MLLPTLSKSAQRIPQAGLFPLISFSTMEMALSQTEGLKRRGCVVWPVSSGMQNSVPAWVRVYCSTGWTPGRTQSRSTRMGSFFSTIGGYRTLLNLQASWNVRAETLAPTSQSFPERLPRFSGPAPALALREVLSLMHSQWTSVLRACGLCLPQPQCLSDSFALGFEKVI